MTCSRSVSTAAMVPAAGGRGVLGAVFDAEGDTDPAVRAQVLDDVVRAGIICLVLFCLVLFCHGWNSDRPRALAFYERFFGLLGDQLRHIPADRVAVVGLGGVVGPSQM